MKQAKRRKPKTKELTMTNGTIPTWQGIPVAGEVHGYSAMPENIPHYYDANIPSDTVPGLFQLQVVAVGYDSAGNIPPDPPIQYQSPLYHRQTVPIPTPPGTYEPRAIFDGGICTSAGWAAPGTTWLKPKGPGQGADPMSTDVWCWVLTDGSIGTAPVTPGTPTLAAYIGQVLAAADALKKFTQS